MMSILSQSDMSLDDFFRSTRESIGEGPRPGTLIALIIICAALLAILVALNCRRNREAALRPINNINKLQRDMFVNLSITREESRELDRAAKELGMSSGLSLLLCPSVLQKAAMETTGEGRRILTGLIKRICA